MSSIAALPLEGLVDAAVAALAAAKAANPEAALGLAEAALAAAEIAFDAAYAVLDPFYYRFTDITRWDAWCHIAALRNVDPMDYPFLNSDVAYMAGNIATTFEEAVEFPHEVDIEEVAHFRAYSDQPAMAALLYSREMMREDYGDDDDDDTADISG
jgi:hypothetical protein